MKKLLLFLLLGAVVQLYTTFVIQNLWNWFATSALHVSAIPFWAMYGLVLLVSAFRESTSEDFKAEQQWKATIIALDACIPDVKREAVNEQIEEQTQGVWVEAGMRAFGLLIGNTFVLVLGYGVHALLA